MMEASAPLGADFVTAEGAPGEHDLDHGLQQRVWTPHGGRVRSGRRRCVRRRCDADTADQLRAAAEQHEQLNIVVIDVVDPASVEACVSGVIAASGRIDVLVNNAAVATSPPSKTPTTTRPGG